MKKSYLLTLSIFASSIAFAEKEEHREHDAHEHGHAQLSVILEKNDLQVMLETPAMNVFGFEHKPENEKQHQSVELAIKDLKNIAPLINLDESAKCSLVKSEVKQPFAMDDDHDGHKDEHDDHKDEHAEHKDEHKHDDDHGNDHKESTHSDVDVEISYTCQNPSSLTKMDLTSFFKRFPLFEELEAQGIINGQQTATEITPKQAIYSLKN